MTRRLLCFLENEKPDYAGRCVLQWAAFLVESRGFEACVFLWSPAPSVEVPEPLEKAQGFCLDGFPSLMQMSTVDLIDIAGELQKRFPADLVLVPSFSQSASLHLLGAAFSSLTGGEFWFGVSECATLPDGNFACRRTLNDRTVQTVASFPLTLAISHHLGIPSYPERRLSLQKLPLSGFSLDNDMLQMRSAVFPEPVSILQVPAARTVPLDEALAFLVPEDEKL